MADIISNKPLLRLTWAEKKAKDNEYFKRMADYYIQNSQFRGMQTQRTHMQTMYQVYNNQIPMNWFSHITDPLNATEQKHKNFPAKVRPTNILRTNIDLLLGEWLRRPFKYRVENIGEDGYNQFLDERNKAVEQSITQLFLAHAQEEAQAQGMTEEQISQMTPDSVPMPEDVKAEFNVSYKDKQAIKGQKWMSRAMQEYSIRRKLHKMFKDWLIAGEAISYKNIHQGELEYKRLSALYSDYDKSPDQDFIEDGEWFTHVFFMTASDVVDMFYDELDDAGHRKLESYRAGLSSPQTMYDYVTKTYSTENQNKVPVYLTLHKGRKRIGYVTSVDPTTGKPTEETIDDVEIDMLPPGTKVKIDWVNEVYETWRVGEDLYFRMQAVPAQRNAMNNFSVCKLPANGKKYSDTHSENISVLQVGIPYLIMYMISGRALEMTIAKSKGKILVMDNNAVPRTKGWNEEKFFYYSEAMGYALIDRNQIGVDKSFNQYQVLDMSLYSQIEQLIQLQAHYKQEWDDIIGISRQRKGQTQATETNASNERAVFQSTVITEMIYTGFDEFVERELQGLLDLSRFTNADGTRRLYNGTEMEGILLEIDPVAYCSASLGLFVTDNPQDYGALEAMKGQAGSFIQNGVKPTTILEMFQAGNIAELKASLKQIEAIEAQMSQASLEKESQDADAMDQRKMQYLEYEKMLEEQLIQTEYDRKEDLESLKGEMAALTMGQSDDANNNGIPDANEVMKNQTEREKTAADERKHRIEQGTKERMEAMKHRLEVFKQEREDARQEKDIQAKEKLEKLKTKGAIAKEKAKPRPPRPSKK